MSVRDELRQSLERGALIFAGAGISVTPPASLPLARPLLEIAADVLGSAAIPLLPVRLQAAAEAYQQQISTFLPLEHLMELLLAALGPEALRLLDIYRHSSPNDDHLTLAALSALQPQNALCTLNFDRLLEEAVETLTGTSAQTVASEQDFERYLRGGAASQPVLHLHGALLLGGHAGLTVTIAATRTTLSRARAAALQRLMADRDILCVGYSNADVDTFPQLLETSRRLFWYVNRKIPPAVQREGAAHLGSRFAVVTRQAGEATFAEVIGTLWPEVATKVAAARALLPSAVGPSVAERREQFGRELEGLLHRSAASSGRIGSFVLSSLADIRGDRVVALELLQAGQELGARSPDLREAETALEGHIHARSGHLRSSLRTYARLARVARAPARQGVARVFAASEALGLWKRFPLNLWHLARWWIPTHGLAKSSSSEVRQLAFFELADFYHFFGEQLLLPSTYAAQLPVGVTTLLRRRLAALEAGARKRGERRRLLRTATRYYAKVLREADGIELDPFAGYTALARLRLLECLAALGHSGLVQSQEHLAVAERFYRWTDTAHGTGNVHMARAVLALYAGQPAEAEAALDLAQAAYGSHGGGERKARVVRFRLRL